MRGFDAVWVGFRLLAGCWLLWRVRRPEPAMADRNAVSVVIPARDEATTLPTLLASLRRECRAGDEVIVVDDHSTDGTATVAEAAGAQVVTAPPLPPDWNGKAWACWTGARVATNDTLVFFDADVTVLPGGLDRVVGTQQHLAAGGLLSVEPYHVMSRPYERLSAFFNIVTMMGTDAFTPVRRPDPTGAFGPCLVTSRVAYESVGGHASVSSELLDDVALARRYRQSSRRVACLGGRGSLSFRMYPRGVRQLLEGWSKNVAAGARSTRVLTLLLIVAWISVCIETSVALAGARDGVALTVYVLVVAQVAWMLRRIGRFGALTAMLYPIPLAFFLLVFVRSTYLTLVRRRVSWKGRTFSSRA